MLTGQSSVTKWYWGILGVFLRFMATRSQMSSLAIESKVMIFMILMSMIITHYINIEQLTWTGAPSPVQQIAYMYMKKNETETTSFRLFPISSEWEKDFFKRIWHCIRPWWWRWWYYSYSYCNSKTNSHSHSARFVAPLPSDDHAGGTRRRTRMDHIILAVTITCVALFEVVLQPC